MNLIIFIIVGGLAGWLAGQVMQGKSLGLVTNVVVGLIGGLIGGWLFDTFGIDVGYKLGGSLITATVGAILLLWIVRMVKK
ncbi:MAG: GlsB/YeaQ/YmgE family stress response membrane protein [Bacteroidota bacterium]